MPIIRDVLLSLKTVEVLPRQGLRQQATVRPEIRLLIREVLLSVKECRLLEPAAVYEYHAVRNMTACQVALEGDKVIHDQLLPAISGVLIPHRSTSMAVGIRPQMAGWTRADACARCSLSKNCHYGAPK